jgi:triosephosphate isomerase (TIM)
MMVAGNWKMHTTVAEGIALAQSVMQEVATPATKVVFGPPATHLAALCELAKDRENYFVAAQNCHQEDSGAYTGEIAAKTLAELGVDYVILGHSERRQYAQETDDLIYHKVQKVLEHSMQPIYCCGENLEVRDTGDHLRLVCQQVSTALFQLSAEDMKRITIAYEPVWAIGTGRTATPEQAQEMHASIRVLLTKQYGAEIAEQTTILYGGSVKPGNAAELFGQPDVDGGLVGGAALKAPDFSAIIRAI